MRQLLMFVCFTVSEFRFYGCCHPCLRSYLPGRISHIPSNYGEIIFSDGLPVQLGIHPQDVNIPAGIQTKVSKLVALKID